MPPKAASSAAPAKKAAAPKKAAAAPEHPGYKEMITDAIRTLKERNGSSRQAIKKYIQSNFKVKGNFDSQFNQALKRGAANGDFIQPKGPSGTVKLNKKEKEAAKPKTAAKKTAKPASKSAAKPKAAVKKTTKPASKAAAKPKPAPKAAAKPASKAASKPKASTTTKAPAAEKPKTVNRTTKSGRVTKTTAPAAKAAPKKKTAAPKKKAAAKTDSK